MRAAFVLTLSVAILSSRLQCGVQAAYRTVPKNLRTGTFLSPLRSHPVTGEDFRPTATRAFLDLMKHSTPFSEGVEQGIVGDASSWVHYNIPADIVINFSKSGYPTRLPSFQQWGQVKQMSVKATIGAGDQFVEDGEYIVTWQGEGNISFEGDSQLLSSEASSARILVRPKSGVVVRLVGTAAANPLHSLSIMPVAFQQNASTQLFHPRFLEMLSSTAVLRFSSWQQIDAWDRPESLQRSWDTRPLPTDQTQAGPLGVCVEYMVELANSLGAHPWFSMPKSSQAAAGSVDPYAAAFATLVLNSLRADVNIYIEYRSCCLNRLAPGWNSQENAVQSLTAWHSWESSGWNASRIINIISSLPQLDNFGSDVGRVEAVAIEASFGELCAYGQSPCVNYDAKEANSTFGAHTPAQVVDSVLRPAMLKREAEVNQLVQAALHHGFEIVAFDAMPLIAARSYGHRGTLNWALQCESCLQRQLGRRFGHVERRNLTSQGWVHEAEFVVYYGYKGIDAADRASDAQGVYWLEGTPEEAKARCVAGDLAPTCHGFSYVRAGEWSCGTADTHRYGDCTKPGTAYFFHRQRISQGETRPSSSCQAYSVPGSEMCAYPGIKYLVDTYFIENVPTPGFSSDQAADDAAVAQCGTCQSSFVAVHWYTWSEIPVDFTLDRLHQVWPSLVAKAASEQSLEQKMVEALRQEAVEDLMLDYLERLRHLGFSLVVGGTLMRPLKVCRSGGKACGQASLMTHPDDDGPLRRAFQSYQLGKRATALPAPEPAPLCPQPCVYGICELGTCKCWADASGADCSQLANATCRNRRKLGISLSGPSYWTREWIFVDVFKHVGSWVSNEFTSYTWGTGTELHLRSDGFPSRLLVNQALQLLTIRDVERHYADGWYTVLYDGEGVLDFNMDVTAVIRSAPGSIRVYLNLTTGMNNGLGIRVSHTREENPLRNIRIITPGFEETYQTSPFHPAFLASLQDFSVLRFMDWMHANSRETPWNWESRSTPSYYSQASSKGVSLEYMIRLSNELGSSPWFALPINATDEYIKEFSDFVAANLRPDLDIFMELGNEAWHMGFYGGQWAQVQGSLQGITFLCWYAQRTAEMAAIARRSLAGRHVTVVAGSQVVNPDATQQLLNCPGINSSDAIGLGPYFDGYGVLPNPDADLGAVLDSYSAEVNVSLQLVREHKALLSGTHLKLVAYEAGPAGVGDGSGTDLAIQAHRHDRMRQIVLTYLEALHSELDLIVYFASCGKPSKYGSWGLIEAMDQPRDRAVKYQAVHDFLRENSRGGSDLGNCTETGYTCATSASCSGNGICGTDDQCYCYGGFSGSACLAGNGSFTDYHACGYRCTFDQGSCDVSQTIQNLRSWACNCHPDYSGATCTKFECPQGCNQRGHCIASGVCSCFRGFRGSTCEIDCGCEHHGQCNQQNECICDQGWRRRAIGSGCEWDCATVDSLGCTGPGLSACVTCQMGTCLDGVCRCWAGYHGPSCSTLNASLVAHAGSSFGINVAMNPSVFVDVMKTSREWTSVWDRDTQPAQFSYQGNSILWTSRQYEWGNGQAINQSSDGYINSLMENQAVISLTLRDVCLHAPRGRYVVTYDGDGELDFGMDAVAAAFQKGRIDIDFAPTCRRHCWFDKRGWEPYCSDNGIAFTIRRTNPLNPLRNIRIIMPGFFRTHVAEPFHPWFLKNLERFASIRFMDWGHTNTESFVKRTPVDASYVRFSVLATEGGGLPRMSELLLKSPSGELVACSSTEAPELCDGDPNTDWAPVNTNASVIVHLPRSKISSYMWMTSGWGARVDPVSWRLDVSQDGATWQQADLRATRQGVTYYRRQYAATGSPEERSWFPIRLPGDLFEWTDRTLPEHRTQTAGPVALEYQVLLANTLGANPWICVHHLASDDYIRKEAEFWLNNLRPDAKLYVEHSNEVWNPLFPQGRYATERGTALGLANSSCRTNSEHCARVRYNAWRSKQIFDIWSHVWGTSRSRLSFVLATQAAWLDVTRDLFSLNQGAGADMLGITAYFDPGSSIDRSWAGKTVEDVIQDFVNAVEPARNQLGQLKALAAELGVKLAVYEGGVGLVEAGTIETGEAFGSITETLMAVGRRPQFQSAVESWLDMYRSELGDDVGFNYFVDTGFWSKYGQWGMREYYDAATATSPAAAAVHAHLDRRDGARPRCVAASSFGRGLPPDSFFGPPAVTEPDAGAVLVIGKNYTLRWGVPERLSSGMQLNFLLWQNSSCEGAPVAIGSAAGATGFFKWKVPVVTPGDRYFVELRPAAPSLSPSNFSAYFTIVQERDAPSSYLLFVENDVDLLSAFHRDCKKGSSWAIQPDFAIESCVYSSAEGCRQYRTSRKMQSRDGPPPWRHGSFQPITDCTLHVMGLRQTMRLEGLTRGFELGSEDAVASAVANASLLPSGAISVSVRGGSSGRRLSAITGVVTLELSIESDDTTSSSAALGLVSLSENVPFLGAMASSLGEANLQVAVQGSINATDGAAEEAMLSRLAAAGASTTGAAISTSLDDVSTSSTSTSTTRQAVSGSMPDASSGVTGAAVSGCVLFLMQVANAIEGCFECTTRPCKWTSCSSNPPALCDSDDA
eukprot:TRINITY_DN24783_c0_g1_i1.p1 TRINITY_DN24783_c0_g1~~TRINITY_DN24783_c0_g1_i1.p1  ORF type:complete len:2581 (+),score=311.66 TRINITY_DN24783_c0_g1_i1:162-7904(+)